jgi:hypothetical protein
VPRLGLPTILITKDINDVPFDYKHLRCIAYNTEEAGWERRLQNDLSNTIAATLSDGDFRPDLSWPYAALGVDAGLSIRETRYRFAEVLDADCEYVLLTGHNFGDQLGMRDDPHSILYDRIIHILEANKRARIQLTFAPPDLLKRVHPPGYKDLVEISFPRMWDLANDPRVINERNRLRITTHRGAMFMSVFVRDPNNADRGLIVTTPRWVTDDSGRNRMFVAVWKKERPELFEAVWSEIESSLRTFDKGNVSAIVEQLGQDLGQDYVDFVQHRVASWQLPE